MDSSAKPFRWTPANIAIETDFLRQRKSAAEISAAIGFKKTRVHRIVGELQSYPMLNFHSEMESVSIQQAAIHLVF